jgi:hypothetical protein
MCGHVHVWSGTCVQTFQYFSNTMQSSYYKKMTEDFCANKFATVTQTINDQKYTMIQNHFFIDMQNGLRNMS